MSDRTVARQRVTRSGIGLVLICGSLWALRGSPAGWAASQRIEMTTTNQLHALLQHNSTQRIQAPDFPLDVDWLNVEQPLTIQALRGKIVLLDFWTFCCINCMHVLAELRALEARYPDELVVVGVHSAKFRNEQVTDQIRQSVLRYEIAHPVLNDAGLSIWNAYGVHAWPTLVLIDPEGAVVLQLSGEGHGPLLDAAIQWLIRRHEDRGTLNQTPLPLQLEARGALTTALRFPGKVLVSGEDLFIADSNHHQLLVADREGRIRYRIGAGSPGRRDGNFTEAQFRHPQGMARDADWLYVADTENHLIRALDLTQRVVRTIAGTGQQGHVLHDEAPAGTAALNSPWDLALVNGILYIAMAGAHQIWSLDVQRGVLDRYAGTGQEQILDGPLTRCALAQPSGITADPEGNLYVADSEISAVRKIDRQRARIDTLIGQGLFVFGDRDGPWNRARLQHPLGIVWHDGALYLADSYNHKIKRLNLVDRTIETLAGTGTPGNVEGTPGQLAEPGGLHASDGVLYIADTNNHLIRRFDLGGSTLSTLPLQMVATTVHAQQEDVMTFTVQSAAFRERASIPTPYTCEGADVSPPLRWTDPPPQTKSFALIVDDPDAPVGTWVHWVLYNLPAEARDLPKGVEPDATLANGAVQGINDFRRVGYGGPCPPPGPSHRYVFKLYALDALLSLPSRATKAQLERAMEGHILARTQLIGRYQR